MAGFKKCERLCHFRLRKFLFERGNTFLCYPFKVVYFSFDKHDGNNAFSDGDASSNATSESMPTGMPLKPTEKFCSDPYPASVLISVPSRRFRRAVDRNKIKRLTREAYRNNKSGFYRFLNERELHCLVAFIYIGSKIPDYIEVATKITVSLQKIESLAGQKRERNRHVQHP